MFEGLNEPINNGLGPSQSASQFVAFRKALRAGDPAAQAGGPSDVGHALEPWLTDVIAAGEPAEELGRIVRSLRDWGRDCYCAGGENNTCGKRFSQQFGTLPPGFDHKYVYSHIGYNLKLTDIQAAIGCAQWQKLPEFISRRKANFAYLRKTLAPYEDRLVLPGPTPGADPAWFGFVITVREGAGFTRTELQRHLEERKIETRALFAGNLLRHPAFLDIPHRVCGGLDNTDRITESTFFVGVYPGLDAPRLEHMAEAFRGFMNKR